MHQRKEDKEILEEGNDQFEKKNSYIKDCQGEEVEESELDSQREKGFGVKWKSFEV